MRRRRPSHLVGLAGLAALWASTAACSSVGGGARPVERDGPSTTADAGRSEEERALEDDRELIEAYVAASRARDAEAAIARRCETARPNDAELFAVQLDQLQDREGDITLVDVEPTSYEVIGPGTAPRTRRVTLAYGGDPAPPVLLLSSGPTGDRQLCGWSPGVEGIDRDRVPAVGDPTDVPLDQLLPQLEGPWTRAPDAPGEAAPGQSFEEVGILDDARATWKGPGVRHWVVVQVLRYDSPEAALDDATTMVRGWEPDAVETFELTSVAPAAQGTRFLAAAWLWVAPVDRGAHIDSAVAVRGDTVLTVQEAGMLDDGHDLVADLIRQMDERADG